MEINGLPVRLPGHSFSICDPDEPLGRSDAEVIGRFRAILQKQTELYASPLGDPASPGAEEYRFACIIQGLYLTSDLKLPGVRAFGLDSRPHGQDAEQLTIAMLEKLGWGSSPRQPVWSEMYKRDHPMSVLVYDKVFAASIEEAHTMYATARDELLAVLSLNRGAAGRPIVTCLEQIDGEQVIATKFRFEHSSYAGNLAGGFLSGESQSDLLMQHSALSHDPLLKLCVDLFREALADPSPDARYFRFWSTLETLAIGRVPGGLPVVRLDGSPWPNESNSSHAAPRVYTLIADALFRGPVTVDEASAVSPAEDLATAVTHWYARRNATAHYGQFVADDSVQRTKNWYPRALATGPTEGAFDDWLRTLQRLCGEVLLAELARIGAPLVP
ncbi:hypothetical protein SRABI128_06346 [Microbacterium sp. Bi128]|nr:hypothetical protein SRABI128_06346 [Microbacterium sp. Bi128]